MRRALLALLALLPAACGDDTTPDAAVLGAACTSAATCHGYVCVEDACTLPCTSSADCAAIPNSDCYEVDGTLACVPRTYATGAGAYGTNCALNGEADCAADFDCLKARVEDPDAYCSAACTTDRDCPIDSRCEAGAAGNRCVHRDLCWECAYDDQCDFPDGFCSPTEHRCLKRCEATSRSCPAGFECVGEGEAAGCVHLSGACVGDGTMCAPCLRDSDCGAMTDGFCGQFLYSHERFCSGSCSTGCGSPYVCITSQDVCYPPDTWSDSCATRWN